MELFSGPTVLLLAVSLLLVILLSTWRALMKTPVSSRTPQSTILPNGMRVFHLLREEVEFLYQTIFEEEEYLRHNVQLHADDTIVDVGGNVGLFSLYCHRKLGGRLRLLAFEPLPPIYRVLEQNFALANRQQIALARTSSKHSEHREETEAKEAKVAATHQGSLLALPYGLSSRPQKSVRFFYYPFCSLWSGAYADTSKEELSRVSELVLRNLAGGRGQFFAYLIHWCPIPSLRRYLVESVVWHWNQVEEYESELRTLSAVIDEHGLDRIDLLKIDCEKAELEVLEGVEERHWPLIRQVVAEVHDIDDRVNRMVELLRSHGFCNIVTLPGPPPFFMVWRMLGVQSPKWTVSNMYHLYATRDIPAQ